MEAVVLAGGLGTRLRGVIGEQPKCMAPINGHPFLYYLLLSIEGKNIAKVVLALGYKHEVVLEWLSTQKFSFQIDYVIEEEPLGTGGATVLALTKTQGEDVLILNGDTLFLINFEQFYSQFDPINTETLIALKPLEKFDRYGSVTFDNSNFITAFNEKQFCENGYINGGVYLINKKKVLERKLPFNFSFETDYLAQFVHEAQFKAVISEGYFIDIGVPHDYEQAQEDFLAIFDL